VNQKNNTRLLPITSANVDRFTKFFYYQVPEETFYVTITGTFTSPQLCCYTTLVNSKI